MQIKSVRLLVSSCKWLLCWLSFQEFDIRFWEPQPVIQYPQWDSCSQLKCNFHPLLGSTALHPSNSFLPKQVILTLGEAMTQWGNILHLHILNMEAERSSWCYGAHWTMKVCKWEDAFIFKTFLLDSPKRFYSTTLTFVILGTQLTGVSPALSWHLTTAAFCLCGVESFGYRTLSIFKVCETEALASI